MLLVSGRWPERALLRAALLEEGLEVIGARDLFDGLVWLEEEPVRLAIVDLPCRGQGALPTVRERWPELLLLLLSGPFAGMGAEHLCALPGVRMLRRPFSVAAVVRAACSMLRSTTAEGEEPTHAGRRTP
ncbi:MAG: hypothetical protein H5T59_10410 [Anaerolineae bacterium]|nr:hypothetical protein [Anaerolineae bacterium]